jgi:nucleoside-diphosphate-sugar epimerase
MFEAALMTGVQRVLFASSGAVFGPKSVGVDGILANDAAYDPQNVYGGTKAMNEVVARAYTAQYGIDVVGVRPTSYGPVGGGTIIRWLPELIEALLAGRPGTAPGGVGNGRWLYVEDMARALMAALNVTPCPNTTLTLPIGFPATNDEVIEIIRRAIPGAAITVTPPPAHWTQGPTTELHHDDRLAVELLGWRPTTGVEEGVARIIGYHRAALAARADAVATTV